jgi:adenylate cyclase
VRVQELLLEAIESDPNRSIARSSMGQLRRVQNRLTESRIEYETAITLDPNDDFAHVQLGWTLLFLSRPSAAIAEGEAAVRLSPRDPQMWGKYLQLGWCQLLSNQPDPAIDLFIKSRAANPRTWVTHFGLAGALGLKGDLDGANTVLADLLKIKPESTRLLASVTSVPGAILSIGGSTRKRPRLACAERVSPTSDRCPRLARCSLLGGPRAAPIWSHL